MASRYVTKAADGHPIKVKRRPGTRETDRIFRSKIAEIFSK